jgi:hypothetical protein
LSRSWVNGDGKTYYWSLQSIQKFWKLKRSQRPETKAYQKEYYSRPETKAKLKVYRNSPSIKAKAKEKRDRPEVKAKALLNATKISSAKLIELKEPITHSFSITNFLSYSISFKQIVHLFFWN